MNNDFAQIDAQADWSAFAKCSPEECAEYESWLDETQALTPDQQP